MQATMRSDPMITTDMATRTSAPGPMPSAGMIEAATVAAEVMTIGRKRIGPPSRIASRRDLPCSYRCLLKNSTSRIEFFSVMPMSTMMPMKL